MLVMLMGIMVSSCSPLTQQEPDLTSSLASYAGSTAGLIGPMMAVSMAASASSVMGRAQYPTSSAYVQANNRQLNRRTRDIRMANKQLAYLNRSGATRQEELYAEAVKERMRHRIDEDIATARAALSEASRDEQRELEKTIDELENARENL